jgi:hypothetical protein
MQAVSGKLAELMERMKRESVSLEMSFESGADETCQV